MPGSENSGKSTISEMAIDPLTGHQKHDDEDYRYGADKAADEPKCLRSRGCVNYRTVLGCLRVPELFAHPPKVIWINDACECSHISPAEERLEIFLCRFSPFALHAAYLSSAGIYPDSGNQATDIQSRGSRPRITLFPALLPQARQRRRLATSDKMMLDRPRCSSHRSSQASRSHRAQRPPMHSHCSIFVTSAMTSMASPT